MLDILLKFLSGDTIPKFESFPQNMEYPIGTRRNKDGKPIHLEESQWMACHRYILFNCGNKDVESLLEEHRALIDATKVLKRQFVTIYQLQQQQRTKKCTEVCSPRKSARLNNVPVKIPTEVKRYRKSGEGTEVTSTKKSTRPMSARLEINDMISKQKPKSTEKKGARKSTPINNQASNGNVNLKSSSVRRKLDLHNPRDEDENTDENDIQIEYLPPPPPLESSPVKLLTIMEYEMIKLENIRRNNEKLKALNLPTLATEKVDSMKKNNGKRNSRDENAYVPEKYDQSGDDASESVPQLQ
ncbi:hypothetical protein POM88_015712 [Heracleum sosnowskyi]|uniref:Uncharacterized protein n=1 Tax=Heracleum sosnowskyi TaxID=360622 RepID=A0AAD8IKD3_9APIA|nr:hypothetical protein POM88_015712 [Heracleum sosnowskyi]